MSHVRQKWAGGQVKQMTGFDGVKAISTASNSMQGVFLHPNEPAGFSLIAENTYVTVPGLAGGGGVNNQPGAIGWWWRASDDNLSIQAGSGHPLADTYLQITYPADLPSGVGPAFFIGWSNSDTFATQMRELYVQTVFRYRGPASDPGNWAWEPTTNKVYYIPYMGTNRVNQSILGIRRYPFPGAGSYVIDNEFRTEPRVSQIVSISGTAQAGTINTITLQDIASINLVGGVIKIVSGTGTGQVRIISGWDNGTRIATVSQAWDTIPDSTSVYGVCDDSGGGAVVFGENQAVSSLFVGNWYEMEELYVLNTQTCPATSDGERHLWINGELRATHTNVRYTSISPWNVGFHQYRFDPVWGGVNPIAVPADQYLDIAYSYISGIPK